MALCNTEQNLSTCAVAIEPELNLVTISPFDSPLSLHGLRLTTPSGLKAAILGTFLAVCVKPLSQGYIILLVLDIYIICQAAAAPPW